MACAGERRWIWRIVCGRDGWIVAVFNRAPLQQAVVFQIRRMRVDWLRCETTGEEVIKEARRGRQGCQFEPFPSCPLAQIARWNESRNSCSWNAPSRRMSCIVLCWVCPFSGTFWTHSSLECAFLGPSLRGGRRGFVFTGGPCSALEDRPKEVHHSFRNSKSFFEPAELGEAEETLDAETGKHCYPRFWWKQLPNAVLCSVLECPVDMLHRESPAAFSEVGTGCDTSEEGMTNWKLWYAWAELIINRKRSKIWVPLNFSTILLAWRTNASGSIVWLSNKDWHLVKKKELQTTIIANSHTCSNHTWDIKVRKTKQPWCVVFTSIDSFKNNMFYFTKIWCGYKL